MSTTTEVDPLQAKTLELCETLTQQPAFQSIRQRIDTFMTNDDAKTQYQRVSEAGEYLQHKQEQGVELTQDEISDFEKERDQLFQNDAAKGFLEAQDEMRRIQESVGQLIGKTFEMGKVPDPAELESGCGPSCGCH